MAEAAALEDEVELVEIVEEPPEPPPAALARLALVEGDASHWTGGVVVDSFARFYEHVAGIKVAIAEGRLQSLLGSEIPARPEPRDLAAAVSARLLRWLSRERREMAQLAEVELLAWEQAEYLMVALADEIFILELDWPGREAWLDCLLEQARFEGRKAGQEFFVRLEALLRSRARSTAQRDLAAVFLLALQLGFKGRFRGQHGAPTLAVYRRRLIRFLSSDWLDEGHAFPEAYGGIPRPPATAAAEKALDEARRLAPLRPWILGGLIGIAVYLLVSSAIWFITTRPLTHLLRDYEAQGGP